MVAAGFSGSKVIAPEIPVAVPEMDSKGASKRNKALLTFLGSLKSKTIGSAFAFTKQKTAKAPQKANPTILLFIISVCIFFKRVRRA